MISVRYGKGGKSAWTMLPASTRAALAAWYTAAGSPPATSPVFPVPAGLPVPGGHHYAPQSLGRVVQRILKRAGCWHRGAGSAHRFRRSFATQYLKANSHDLVGLKTLMRHENIATTARYAFLEPEDLLPRMAALEL